MYENFTLTGQEKERIAKNFKEHKTSSFGGIWLNGKALLFLINDSTTNEDILLIIE